MCSKGYSLALNKHCSSSSSHVALSCWSEVKRVKVSVGLNSSTLLLHKVVKFRLVYLFSSFVSTFNLALMRIYSCIDELNRECSCSVKCARSFLAPRNDSGLFAVHTGGDVHNTLSSFWI